MPPIKAQLFGEVACAPPEYFRSKAAVKEIINISMITPKTNPKIIVIKIDQTDCRKINAPYASISFLS